MLVMRKAEELVGRLLAGREAAPGAAEMSACCVTEEVPGGRVLFHTLTKEMIFLAEGEEQTEYLRRHFFLKEAGADERPLIRELRDTMRFLHASRRTGYTRYTILPTTDCNARCFYCYEVGCEKLNMDPETVEQVISFILSSSGEGELTLCFFGGEPMMGERALDRICGALAEAGRAFHSVIVSNGYLFTPENIRKAVDLWHLKKAQITLDGTEPVYNERKDYITDHDGAFRRVTDNIEALLRAGIAVQIRLNMDEVNLPDLKQLASQLAARYGGYENLTVYPYLLFQDILSPSQEKVDRLFALYRTFRGELTEAGLLKPGALPDHLRLNHCMADDPESIVILPDGRLHVCEHFEDGHDFGTVWAPRLRNTEEAYWTAEFPEDEFCGRCPLYPECIRMKNCPDEPEHCLPQQREAQIEKLRARMRAAWQKACAENPAAPADPAPLRKQQET